MMKLNIMSYYLLIFVMLMLYSSLTFAPWSYERLPARPIHGLQERTCPEWINYHGFTLDNYVVNREMAKTRTHILDKDAFKWAAIYAYVIDEVETTNELLPGDFCSIAATLNGLYSYFPLKDERRTCIGWIILYQFSLGDVGYNVLYAKNRSPGKNYATSIWVDSYYSYLITNKDGITPKEFCSKIGKFTDDFEYAPHNLLLNPRHRRLLETERETTGYNMNFMSEYDTNKTCGRDIKFNYDKAMQLINEKSNYDIFIQYWPLKYSKFLVKNYYSGSIPNSDMKPNRYCFRILFNEDESKKYSFHYDPDDFEAFDE